MAAFATQVVTSALVGMRPELTTLSLITSPGVPRMFIGHDLSHVSDLDKGRFDPHLGGHFVSELVQRWQLGQPVPGS